MIQKNLAFTEKIYQLEKLRYMKRHNTKKKLAETMVFKSF